MKKQEKPLQPYQYDKLAKIPSFWKILLLKWWASGATFFFTFSVAGVAELDKLILSWLILAIVIEYLIQKVIYWMSNDKDKTERFLAYRFERKKVINLVCALVYSAAMIFLIYFLVENVFQTYTLDRIFFPDAYGVGPIMFGTLYVLLDLLWISILNAITKTKMTRG